MKARQSILVLRELFGFVVKVNANIIYRGLEIVETMSSVISAIWTSATYVCYISLLLATSKHPRPIELRPTLPKAVNSSIAFDPPSLPFDDLDIQI